MKYLLLLTAVLLVSCDGPQDPVPMANTALSLKNPETIGSLPDGRVIKCAVRDRGHLQPHYIYFVDGVTTTNYQAPSGKTTVPQVIVEIDGVKYVPIEDPKSK